MKTLLAVLAALAVTAPAYAAAPVYRTDNQAEKYLRAHLTRWAGLDARGPGEFVSCMNGAYSRVERRTGHHYPQGQRTVAGENMFASFACVLGVPAGRAFSLYVVPVAGAWRITADR